MKCWATSWEGDRRRSARLAALDARFRSALHSVLSDQLPGLTAAVGPLNDEATALPKRSPNRWSAAAARFARRSGRGCG